MHSSENFKPTKLSVAIPVYNEERTVKTIIEKVIQSDLLGLDLEIIIVDDCSTDKTWNEIKVICEKHECLVSKRHATNKGKGAAIKTALKVASGSIVLIQDGDLEYDPKDYPSLLRPILEARRTLSMARAFAQTRKREFYIFGIE